MQLADDADKYLPEEEEEQPKPPPAARRASNPSGLEEAQMEDMRYDDDKRALTPSSPLDLDTKV